MTDMSIDQPAPSWLRERAETFVTLVTERGMVMTVEAAEVVISDRTQAVARDMGITTKNAQLYLDDVVLSGLATPSSPASTTNNPASIPSMQPVPPRSVLLISADSSPASLKRSCSTPAAPHSTTTTATSVTKR